MRREISGLLGLAIGVLGLLPSGVHQDAGGTSPRSFSSTTGRLRDAVSRLTVEPEVRAGYDRDKFKLWVDADGDCRDTRDEVLAEESLVAVSGCDVTVGRWYSYYDSRTWTHSSDVDIDHVVPLAEAWDSGARRWTSGTRQRYANDLGDPRTLVAVTDNVNQSKGDQDVSEWLPQHGVCRYVRAWTAVKTRWSLTVDGAEKHTLEHLAAGCANTALHVTKARIALRPTGGGAPQPTGRERIEQVVYDPPGTDTENAETLTVVDRGRPGQLRGYRLSDSAGASYIFPAYRIGRDGTVVVHSGDGQKRRGHLYAGWGFTWNNTGDTARLLTPAGKLADTCGWSDGPGTVQC
jgi:hypothetical protein